MFKKLSEYQPIGRQRAFCINFYVRFVQDAWERQMKWQRKFCICVLMR